MTYKILAPSVFALLAAGCSNQGGPTSAPPTAAGSGPRVATAGAVRVAGDLVPSRLVAVSIPAPTETVLIQGSDALAPKKPYAFESPGLPVTGSDLHRVMQGDPATFTVPVDSPAGARFIIHPVDSSIALPTVHLIDVATGNRLDLARDETNGVNSVHDIHATAPTSDGVLRDATGTPAPRATGGALQREPGFEPLLVHTRVLSIDRPFTAGVVRIQVPAAVAASGIYVELQQKNTHISITAVADQENYSFGDVAHVTCTVMNDSTPISGATLDGTVEMPDHTMLPTLSFTSSDNGTYVASLPLASAELKDIGVYGIHVHALGASSGTQFERDVETAVGFYPAHAQLTALGTPVISRGSDGLIDAITFDADVETLLNDRFALRGTLTYTADDGTEHALASAQTGQTLAAGKGTITLRFDNASMALARVNGPFHLRDVALVSQGFGHTQYRLGRALDLATPAIAAREIRFPTQIPLQAQDLIDNGDLEAVNK
jgi:hypothetical protein